MNPSHLSQFCLKIRQWEQSLITRGKYLITSDAPAYKIRFSYLGYETETHIITPGKTQTINISLKESSVNLNEVVVKPKKESYSNRKNPSVELIEKVIANKEYNRKERLDYLEYDKYEKLKFGLINLNEKLTQAGTFKNFSFIFDNLDTNPGGW